MTTLESIRQNLTARDLDALLITDEKNLLYATGFAFTDGAVLITRERAFLLTDSRYIEAAQREASEGTQVLLFGTEKPLGALLRELIQGLKIQRLGAEEEKLSHAAWSRYEELLGLSLIAAGEILSSLRASKTAREIELMTAAQRIAEAALEEVLGFIRPGVSETELAAEINYQMQKRGAQGISFDTIAITGKNTSMPHGVPGESVIETGDFVTMDFGCIKNGYCSDMTRTVAVGHADDEMRRVYETVLEAQKRGIETARAGITGAQLDAAAREVIRDAGYGEYFGHSFGHSLGLDIHEKPVAAPSAKTLLPAGCVISAEPGIYLPGRFGVRIEDVLVLREGGCENLTKAPKGLIIL